MHATRLSRSINRSRRRPKWGCAVLAVITFAASGCETARRLAPGGFIVVERVDRDIPDNEFIAEQVRVERLDKSARKYPRLGDIPASTAQLPSDPAQRRIASNFMTERDGLISAGATDQLATDGPPPTPQRVSPIQLETPDISALQTAGRDLQKTARKDLETAAGLFSGVFDAAPDRNAVEEELSREDEDVPGEEDDEG